MAVGAYRFAAPFSLLRLALRPMVEFMVGQEIVVLIVLGRGLGGGIDGSLARSGCRSRSRSRCRRTIRVSDVDFAQGGRGLVVG
jgi:hypothetical protein